MKASVCGVHQNLLVDVSRSVDDMEVPTELLIGDDSVIVTHLIHKPALWMRYCMYIGLGMHLVLKWSTPLPKWRQKKDGLYICPGVSPRSKGSVLSKVKFLLLMDVASLA